MLVSLKKQVRERVWAVLNASAAVTATLGGRTANKIDPATRQGQARSDRNASPDTYPRIRVDEPRTVCAAFSKPDSFGFAFEDETMVEDGASGSIEWTFELSIVVTSEWVGLDQNDQLADDVQVALILDGPRLHLAFVRSTGPFTSTQREVNSDAPGKPAGTRRIQTTIKAPVQATVDLQWLKAQVTAP